MTYKRVLTLTLAFMFVSTATFAVAAPAYADCSYNGYINSNGRCAKSYDDDDRYEDNDDDRYYNYQYENRYKNRNVNFAFNDQAILALIARLQEMIRLLEDRLDDRNANSSDTTAQVFTRSAVDVEDDSATLRGRIDLNREDEAEVWFEYGESRSNLKEDTDRQTIDDNDDSFSFDEDIRDLDDNTVYYFRAASEDEDGDEDLGAIFSFRTDRDSSGLDLPDVDTREEDDVTEDSAELNGYVDMNDFRNGRVFFVYGEDESEVEDVEDDYDTYGEVDENGDDLQKVSVDSDLDNSSTYQETVDDLDADTRIYYSICVDFEDDNNDRILCSTVESFETDKN